MRKYMEIHVVCPHWQECAFKTQSLGSGSRVECCILNDDPTKCKLIMEAQSDKASQDSEK